LVWIKSRSAARDHKLTDSVRGATKALISNSTAAETTDSTGITAFTSNGFTLGASSVYNNSGATYVAWCWQAGQGTTSSNTNGTITSTVSVNASAGFSIVTYTGTGAAATVGHGLGVAPSMIIYKQRSQVSNWTVMHKSLANMTTSNLLLNSTAAVDTLTNTVAAPTSSTFGVSLSVAGSGQTCVAYCWTPIAGFSAFGSFVGNGSSDGTFVYTGFRPRFVMFKQTNAVSDWQIIDTARSPYNVTNTALFPNLSIAETTAPPTYDRDFLSNGFKMRSTASYINGSGNTFIYMAYAENPLKYSLAR
jgi:hypothetical protein